MLATEFNRVDVLDDVDKSILSGLMEVGSERMRGEELETVGIDLVFVEYC